MPSKNVGTEEKNALIRLKHELASKGAKLASKALELASKASKQRSKTQNLPLQSKATNASTQNGGR
ncbi:hypothetical protein [Peribacillus sp. SI8-4]|uniref:hypothetical protein n=1 Tax=Peribacillus sp. SI8-4 TaxID=3048009 RepID=UPI0025566383|nr:hypothetical protein [Peribacillus sp. SI8-4]